MTTIAISAPINAGRVISPALRPKTLRRKVIHFFLHSSPLGKVFAVGTIILLGSLLQLLDVVPDSIFAYNFNPANQYLAKLSWLWTLIFILAALTITAPLYSGLKWKMTIRHFSRLVIGHLVWYCGTYMLNLMDNALGKCTVDTFNTYRTCTKAGHTWNGFNISGHTFLLTYCILIITEEASNVKLEVWDGFSLQDNRVFDKLGPQAKLWLIYWWRKVGGLVEVTEIYGLSLVLVWILMVTTTSLYFHTFLEKMIGFFFGVGCWYVSYDLVYGISAYVPCKPSDGTLHPIKHLTFRSPQVG